MARSKASRDRTALARRLFPAWTRIRRGARSRRPRIENSRDVTLGEDRSRTRTNPGVSACLRSFASSIPKANRTDTLSQDRCRAGLAGIKELLKMLAVPQR